MAEFNWTIEDIGRAQRDFSNNFICLDCIETESFDIAIDCMTECIERLKATKDKSSKYISAEYAMKRFRRLADKKFKIAETESNEFYRGMAHGYFRAADILSMMEAADVQSVSTENEKIKGDE